MTGAEILVPNKRMMLTELADKTGVLLNLDTKFYYTLNQTGVFIWKTITEKSEISISHVVDKLCDVFDVEREQADSDINVIVNEMIDEKLVDLVS